MNPLLVVAALLTFAIGCAHSYLGERHILIRLFKRDNLPRLFGSDWFTKRTLRWTWHATTVAWWGFAALLLILASAETAAVASNVLRTISLTFAVSGAISLFASRGRHLSWIFFLAIAVLSWWAAG